MPAQQKAFSVSGKGFAPVMFGQDKKYIFGISVLTLDTIIKELRNVPVDRLKDLYSIIHSFWVDTGKHDHTSKQILSAGCLSDLSEND